MNVFIQTLSQELRIPEEAALGEDVKMGDDPKATAHPLFVLTNRYEASVNRQSQFCNLSLCLSSGLCIQRSLQNQPHCAPTGSVGTHMCSTVDERCAEHAVRGIRVNPEPQQVQTVCMDVIQFRTTRRTVILEILIDVQHGHGIPLNRQYDSNQHTASSA